MTIYSGFTHWKMVIFHRYVYKRLPEGRPNILDQTGKL